MSRIVLQNAPVEVLKKSKPYIDPWIRLVHDGVIHRTPVVGSYRNNEKGKGYLYLDDYNDGCVYAFSKRKNDKKPNYVIYKGGRFYPCDKMGRIKKFDDLSEKKLAHYRIICFL